MDKQNPDGSINFVAMLELLLNMLNKYSVYIVI